jgi:hypothetical protein
MQDGLIGRLNHRSREAVLDSSCFRLVASLKLKLIRSVFENIRWVHMGIGLVRSSRKETVGEQGIRCLVPAKWLRESPNPRFFVACKRLPGSYLLSYVDRLKIRLSLVMKA